MYKVVIGLEVHCELKTKSKVFSSAPNTYDVTPNINVSPVDVAFPGVMPVTNKGAVELALKTALALNCDIADELIFDRKNYFYPDLPKGYQITQNTKPLGVNGILIINVDGHDKTVNIKQLHLEEDTASLDHFDNYSLLDYNRAGIPLIEIVTEPCLNSSREAVLFLEALRSVFLYCDVSEAKSDKGQMRCDVNISITKSEAETLGTKVELKNINSFNNVKDAIEYEVKRQTELLKSGKKVLMETRRFDDDKRKTYSMRTKVEATDYKYFIDPNLPAFPIASSWLTTIKKTIPMLQYERINKYMNEYELSRYDATILVKDKKVADFFENTLKYSNNYKTIVNWVNGIILSHLNKYELTMDDLYITPLMLIELINQVDSKVISNKQGKEVLYQALEKKQSPIDIIKTLDIKQIQDDSYIKEVVTEVLTEN
ncbi:MAG: Asp-tRNA(Asn)/Glu-tRNA(Gln) amidotransferase subunit GatB, partial [Bacilli bacterium]